MMFKTFLKRRKEKEKTKEERSQIWKFPFYSLEFTLSLAWLTCTVKGSLNIFQIIFYLSWSGFLHWNKCLKGRVSNGERVIFICRLRCFPAGLTGSLSLTLRIGRSTMLKILHGEGCSLHGSQLGSRENSKNWLLPDIDPHTCAYRTTGWPLLPLKFQTAANWAFNTRGCGHILVSNSSSMLCHLSVSLHSARLWK